MNELFLSRMKSYIPEEFDDYYQSLSNPLYRGLRINTKKIDAEQVIKDMPYLTSPSNFFKDTYYVDSALGNHAYHICGAFYLQEPSASSVVSVLDVQSDDIVLDLCAAPGSKTTQIAQLLGPNGFLVSNEIDNKRVLALLSNMERMGVMNMAVTNSKPNMLCDSFQGCFDKVLVDAPCSGEGMMKKHDIAKDNWSLENILFCAKRQKEILSNAYKALKKDGILVYSTCTYAKEENEDVVSWFLNEFKDMELVQIEVDFGRPGFIEGTRRIFPMDGGEGHFIAKFQKKSGNQNDLPILKNAKIDKLVSSFVSEQIKEQNLNYYVQNDHVYCMNHEFVDFKKIKVLRQGIYVGQVIKKRFEPAHAFYMCSDFEYLQKIEVDLKEMDDFMHGLEIDCFQSKGYKAICFHGICFGFGKCDGNRLKNKIPKGLRLMSTSKVLN